MASKFTITAQLNLQTPNLTQTINNLRQQFQGANLKVNITNMAQAQANMTKLTKSAQASQKSFNSLGNSVASAAKRFSAITLATGTLVGFTRAVKNAVSEAIEFEREVVKIAQATGKTTEQLRGLTTEVTSVATSFGVSSKELIQAARELTQAGFAADKVAGSLKLLAQTELAATFDSIKDTTEGVIAVLNQFGRQAQQTGNEVQFLEKSLSAINQVSKDFAVESSDLITAIRTTGSAFESAGGSLNELLALFTSVRSTTRESAESIATGFRTIFTRTQRLDTINNLRSLGVELQDVEGKFVGPMEAVKRLSIALNSIDPRDFRFNLIVEELGGFRQVSKVIPLIQQFAVTQKALNVAQSSSGSLAKDAATAQQSLAVQIQKTRERFLGFIRDMTQSSTFQGTVKSLLNLAESFLRVAESIKPLIPLIATFSAFKVGSALGTSFLSLGKGQRRASGGPIHHFASGGMVPGSGNGDTVPAQLTPGEFVIRKSSVQKLGAGNLAKMNKYGRGGAVQFYGTKTGAGLVTADDQSKQVSSKVKNIIPKSQIADYVEPSDKPYINLKRQSIELNKQNKIKIGKAFGLPTEYKVAGNGESYAIYGRQSKDSEKDIYRTFEDIVVTKYKDWKLNNTGNMSDEADVIKKNKVGDILGIGDVKFTSSPVGEQSLLKKAVQWMVKQDNNSSNRRFFKENVKNKIDTPGVEFTVFEPPFKGKFSKNEILKSMGLPRDTSIDNYNKINAEVKRFALGGPAGKSRGARAITIPRAGTYTFNKPAGADLDSLSAHKQTYKLNAEDRLDYDVDHVNVDVNKLKVSKELLEKYQAADAQKRGYRFEDILKETGMAKSLSEVKNARLDGITASGDPFEAKSRINAISSGELEDKIYGSIADSISGPEKLARARFNANALTEGEDHPRVGKITVFEDITGGLGAAKNTKSRMGYAEEEAAKQAKEQGKMASLSAQDRLKDLLDKNFASGYIIAGTQYAPIGAKGMHRDVVASLNKKLKGPYQDKIGGMTDDQVIDALSGIFVKRVNRANGGLTEIPWMSKGGAAGTDTVPAMLTPGEFVINKKSAEAIGFSKLDRMNKVGKFAKGGPVGHFAKGGSVTSDPEDPKEKFDKIFDQLNKASSQLSTTFVLVAGSITSTIAQLGTFEKTTADAISSFIGTFTAFRTIGDQMLSISKSIVAESQSRAFSKKLLQAEQQQQKQKNSATANSSKAIATNSKAFNTNTSTVLQNAKTSSGISMKNVSIKGKSKTKPTTQAGSSSSAPESSLEDLATAKAGKLQKLFNVLDGGLTGFSLGVAAGNAAVQYFTTKTRESSDKLSDTIDKLRENILNVSAQSIEKQSMDTFSAATKTDILNRNLNSPLGYAKIGAGALGGAAIGAGVGGAIGSVFGPAGTIAGGAIGSGIGGVAGAIPGLIDIFTQSQKDFDKQVGKVKDISKLFSSSLYQSVSALQSYNKFITSIEKKTQEEVAQMAKKLSSDYATASSNFTQAQAKQIELFGSLANVPDIVKQQFESLKSSISELNKAIDNMIGNLLQKTLQKINIGVQGGQDVQQIQKDAAKKFEAINNPRVKADVEANFIPQIMEEANRRADVRRVAGQLPEFNAKQKNEDIKNLKAILPEIIKNRQGFEKTQFEVTAKEGEIESLKAKKAMLIETQARMKVIGSLNKELALKIAVENMAMSIDKVNSSLSSIESAFDHTVTGLESSIPDPKVFDMLKPVGKNLDDFNNALNKIKGIDINGGTVGKEIAENLLEAKKISLGLKSALEGAGHIGKDFDINKFIEKTLGISSSGAVGQAVYEMIKEAIMPTQGDVAAGRGINTDEGKKKLIETFENFEKNLSERGKSIITQLKENENQQRAIYQKLNESRQKQLELQLEDVDSFERYLSAVAKARGTDLTLAQKNALRFEKQARMVGPNAGNIDAIGQQLLESVNALKGTTDPAKQTALTQSANRAEQALKQLANQSERTSDTLSEIEKIKGQRQAISGAVEEYTFGSNQRRQEMQTAYGEVQKLAQSGGNIDVVSEEQRGAVQGLLDQFKDLPIFNGMTGAQLKAKTKANEARKMGAGEEVAQMIERDTSAPEEKLINELRAIYEEEVKAKEYLSELENAKQDRLIQALAENSAAVANLSQVLFEELKSLNDKDNAGGQGGKKQTIDDLDNLIIIAGWELEFLNDTLDEQRKNLETSLNKLNQQLTTSALTPMQQIINSVAKELEKFGYSIKAAELIMRSFAVNMPFGGGTDEQKAQLKKDIEEHHANVAAAKKQAQAQKAFESIAEEEGLGADMARASGGYIYRAVGGNIDKHPGSPRGTDTVPAWLTEGEFVVNANDTKKHRSLLEKINSGNYRSGGEVGYLARGGSLLEGQALKTDNQPSEFAERQAQRQKEMEQRLKDRAERNKRYQLDPGPKPKEMVSEREEAASDILYGEGNWGIGKKNFSNELEYIGLDKSRYQGYFDKWDLDKDEILAAKELDDNIKNYQIEIKKAKDESTKKQLEQELEDLREYRYLKRKKSRETLEEEIEKRKFTTQEKPFSYIEARQQHLQESGELETADVQKQIAQQQIDRQIRNDEVAQDLEARKARREWERTNDPVYQKKLEDLRKQHNKDLDVYDPKHGSMLDVLGKSTYLGGVTGLLAGIGLGVTGATGAMPPMAGSAAAGVGFNGLMFGALGGLQGGLDALAALIGYGVGKSGFAKGGLVSYFANGGPVSYLAKGTDTVPAMLTPGEFVMKKKAVDKIGVGNLNAMNNGQVLNKQAATGEFGPIQRVMDKFQGVIENVSQSLSGLGGDFQEGTQKIGPFMDSFGRMNFGEITNRIVGGNGGDKCCEASKQNGDAIAEIIRADNERFINAVKEIMGSGGVAQIAGYAGGGSVGGIFQPRGTDTVPAMLSNGEYVIRKSSVDKIGVDALHAINNGQGLVGNKYYASGGKTDGIGLTAPGGSGVFNPWGPGQGYIGMSGSKYDKDFYKSANAFSPGMFGLGAYGLPIGTQLPSAVSYAGDYMSPMQMFANSGFYQRENMWANQSAMANSQVTGNFWNSFNSAKGRLMSGKWNGRGGGWRSLGGAISYLANGGKPNDYNNDFGGIFQSLAQLSGMGMGLGAYGLPIGTQLAPVIGYSSDYVSPTQFYENTLGAQQRQWQSEADYATSAAYGRMQSAFNNNRNFAMGYGNRMGSMGSRAKYKPTSSQLAARARRDDRRNAKHSNGGLISYAAYGGLQEAKKAPEIPAQNLGPNMGGISSAANSKYFGFGMGLGPLGGGGIGGLNWNSDFSAMNPYMMGMGMGMGMPGMGAYGLPIGTALSPIADLSGMMSPMQMFANSGFQQRESMWADQSAAAGSAVHNNFWNSMNYNRNRILSGKWNGIGGGWSRPNSKWKSLGGIISYLAKGGTPISGMNGIGGFGDIASMIPSFPTSGKNTGGGDSFLNQFGGMGMNMFPGMGWMGLPIGTQLQPMLNYGAGYMTPMQMFANSGFQQRENIWNGRGGGWRSLGGLMSYFGGGGSASGDIPAMLTPGEFVMNPNAVKQHGVGFMEHLNKGGQIPKFHTGGVVGFANGGQVDASQLSSNMNVGVNTAGISDSISSSIGKAFSSVGNIINTDSLNNLSNTFNNLVTKLDSVAGNMNGMSMNHQVNHDGQINIGGLDGKNIAEAIKSEVTNMITNQVQNIMRQANNTAKNDNPIG